MGIFSIVALINTITSSVVGTVIFFSNPKSKVNQLFTLFTIAITIWSLAYFFWQIASNEIEALQWVKTLMLGAILIPFFYFHFVTLFIGKYQQFKYLIWTGYLFATFFIIADVTNLLISTVTHKSTLFFSFDFWPTAGPLMLPFLGIWIFFAFYSAKLLWDKYKISKKTDKHYILLMWLGTLIGYIGGCTNFFLWYNIPISPFGNISTAVYVAFVAYGIMRYKLFNIRLVAAQMLVLILWLSLFIRLLISASPQEQFFNTILFIASLVIGFLLMRSIEKEVRTREEISKLATELAGANAHLERLDKMKSEFVSVASHQLRSPLTSIRGYISMIQEGSYGEVSPKVSKILENVAESARNMSLSVEDYLNVSRIEAGRMKYDVIDCDLREIVQNTVSEMLPISLSKGMTLIFRSQFKGSAWSKLDVGKTKQILQNLTDNAFKYTPEKGQVIIVLRKDNKTKKAYVDVTDNGIGISEESISSLFSKFQRAKNAHAVNVNGTGLGLYIAREMARAMGGDITVKSEGEGKGSTFTAVFPLNGVKSEWGNH